VSVFFTDRVPPQPPSARERALCHGHWEVMGVKSLSCRLLVNDAPFTSMAPNKSAVPSAIFLPSRSAIEFTDFTSEFATTVNVPGTRKFVC
jgi:hypothetical protein